MMACTDLDEAIRLNFILIEVYKRKRLAENSSGSIDTDLIVQQMLELRKETGIARKNPAVKSEVLARTLHAVNKELANHIDYRYGAKKDTVFEPAHQAGELNQLIQDGKNSTGSRYKKVAAAALIALGLVIAFGVLIAMGLLSFGALPAAAVIGSAFYSVASVISVAAAELTLIAAPIVVGTGIYTAGLKFWSSALKDDKVFDTAGKTVTAIRSQPKFSSAA